MTDRTFTLPDAELSDWQPPMSKPHKPFTVWERDMPLTNVRVFSYWNGKNWMENHTTIEEAAKSRRVSVYQNLWWRGLKYDPNLRSE